MDLKVKNYVCLFIGVLIFTVGFLPFKVSAQNKPRLKVSIQNVEDQLSPDSILNIRIENLSNRSLTISQVTLSLDSSGDVSESCKEDKCFFAHIPLSKKTLHKGQSIEIEARLDDRHWFYSNSQTFMYRPQPPNFRKRFKNGSLTLFASVLLPTDISPYYEIFPSDKVIVRVDEH